MVLKRIYKSLSWSNQKRVDKLIKLYQRFRPPKITSTREVVELKKDFIAQTIMFDEPKYVIGYQVYVEKGMPKMGLIDAPESPESTECPEGCKCNDCIVSNLEEIDKVIKQRKMNRRNTSSEVEKLNAIERRKKYMERIRNEQTKQQYK